VKPKYEIGQTIYWVDSGVHKEKEIPCPICYGKLSVTIILGDGSQERSECGYCAHGIEGPHGTMKTWKPSADIMSGVITGISNRAGWTYEIGYSSIQENELFKTKAEAEPLQKVKLVEETERAQKWFEDSYKQATKKQIWSTGYHRRCIKDAKRQIEWHELRLQRIKALKGVEG